MSCPSSFGPAQSSFGRWVLLGLLLALPRLGVAITEQEAEASSVRILNVAPTETKTDSQGRTVTTTHSSSGSGFVINEEGDIVTNQHVVEGAEFLWVGHHENGRIILYAVDVSTIWSSEDQDLAVIHCPELHQKPLVLSFFEPAKGMDVYTLGYPGIADEITAVAAVRLLVKDSAGQKKIDVTDKIKASSQLSNYFDASIRHGEVTRLSTHPGFKDNSKSKIELIDNTVITGHGGSGGPLLNPAGEVIGVVGKSRLHAATEHDIDRVYWAIRTTELKTHLDEAHLHYTAAKEPFTAKPSSSISVTGSSAVLPVVEPAHTSVLGVLGISTAVLLAVAALVLGLMRGKRAVGAGTGVTSLVDEKVQRKMDALMAKMNPQGSPAQVAVSRPSGTVWILGGRDSQGRPVRLEFTETLLANSRDGLVIGRSAGHSQLVVNDDSISKQHAQLRKAGAAFLVSDRQSANGTAVNGRVGKPFEEMPLRVGDTLTLGEVKLQFAEA